MSGDTFCSRHCQNCVSFNCPSEECHVVSCPLRCGSQMHTCKLQDHVNNVCPLAEVPCISASYGCPRRMRRQFLGQHLFRCPASIVHCTVEWNRMPRLLGEKRPFLLPPTCNCCNNSSLPMSGVTDFHAPSNHSCLLSYHTEKFDLALTARDQAVLEAGSKVSDKTKGALRSDLTKLFPALPMTSPLYDGIFLISLNGSKFPTISSPHAVIPASPSGLPISDIFDQRSFDFTLMKSDISFAFSYNNTITSNSNKNNKDKSYSVVTTPTQSPDGGSRIKEGDNTLSTSSSTSAPATAAVRSPSTMRLSSSCPLTEKMSWAISDRSLQVDCQMEFFPRYVQKPLAMYTFLCDQDIPRRSYARHMLLHSEAVVQVDYWLEQRCPLAYLGCPFSVVRLRPNSPVAHLAYLPAVNAFTVRYTPVFSREGADSTPLLGDIPSVFSAHISSATPSFSRTTIPPFLNVSESQFEASVSRPPFIKTVSSVNDFATTCRLERLPFQVLKRIVGMLDEVSLMSLSRVSPQLAEICRLSLPYRGIVTPVWQRGQRTGWRISGFVWSLPTCGEPVHSWCITDVPAPLGTQITRHLHSDCAFYEELRAQQPFCLFNPSEKPPFLSGIARQPEFI